MVRMQVYASIGELHLYDVIGADWYGEGITIASVTAALKEMSGQKVKVRINSPGGVADEGVAIYNALRQHDGGVDTYNESLAASAASLIFLAGENRYMATGSRIMIHNASGVTFGNAEDHRKSAEIMDVYDKAQLAIYKENLSLTDEEITAAMNAETWYDADEALSLGFATAKAGKSKEKPAKAAWLHNAPVAFFEESRKEFDRKSAILTKLRTLGS
jgi:ATP-dependent Clp protease, protease subunit